MSVTEENANEAHNDDANDDQFEWAYVCLGAWSGAKQPALIRMQVPVGPWTVRQSLIRSPDFMNRGLPDFNVRVGKDTLPAMQSMGTALINNSPSRPIHVDFVGAFNVRRVPDTAELLTLAAQNPNCSRHHRLPRHSRNGFASRRGVGGRVTRVNSR